MAYNDVTRDGPYSEPANSLEGRVWNLRRANPGNPVKLGMVKVGSLSWQGYADADHHVLLEDARGNKIFESYGNVDLSPITVSYSNGLWLTDLILEDLQSGMVLVEVL